jgi:hypothetical protein
MGGNISVHLGLDGLTQQPLCPFPQNTGQHVINRHCWKSKRICRTLSHGVSSVNECLIPTLRIRRSFIHVIHRNRLYLDGEDVGSVLLANAEIKERVFFYYRGTRIFAVRYGPWKAHFLTQDGYGMEKPIKHDPPLLFQLEHDPSEQYNVADRHPEVLKKIVAIVNEHRANLQQRDSVLEVIEEGK